MYISNLFKYFKRVLKHKYYVGKFCFISGLYWQGITHDLSKFSSEEFISSAKYWGNKSPIEIEKRKLGYSYAWLHHKGRNKHHYEYWQDNFDNGRTPIKMPVKYVKEMICDWFGAQIAYNGTFSYEKQFNWYLENKYKKCAMHEDTQELVYCILNTMKEEKSFDILKNKQRLDKYLQFYNKNHNYNFK